MFFFAFMLFLLPCLFLYDEKCEFLLPVMHDEAVALISAGDRVEYQVQAGNKPKLGAAIGASLEVGTIVGLSEMSCKGLRIVRKTAAQVSEGINIQSTI